VVPEFMLLLLGFIFGFIWLLIWVFYHFYVLLFEFTDLDFLLVVRLWVLDGIGKWIL
jgi:hypothetical protein